MFECICNILLQAVPLMNIQFIFTGFSGQRTKGKRLAYFGMSIALPKSGCNSIKPVSRNVVMRMRYASRAQECLYDIQECQ